MDDQPGIMGNVGSHDALRRGLGRHAPCKILDAPTGQGALAQFLSERGWDVHCGDIDSGHFKLAGKLPFTQVNLNKKLPFEDASFDAVACVNGLQRLYNPGGAIGEFARILRPNGRLFINVNNYASIDKRLRFLFCGSIDSPINDNDVDQTVADPEAHVRNCLLYPQLANALGAARFRIVDLQRSAVLPVHRLLAPISWAVRLIALLVPPQRRKHDHIAATASIPILPGGRYLFIEAIKEQ